MPGIPTSPTADSEHQGLSNVVGIDLGASWVVTSANDELEGEEPCVFCGVLLSRLEFSKHISECVLRHQEDEDLEPSFEASPSDPNDASAVVDPNLTGQSPFSTPRSPPPPLVVDCSKLSDNPPMSAAASRRAKKKAESKKRWKKMKWEAAFVAAVVVGCGVAVATHSAKSAFRDVEPHRFTMRTR